VATVAKCSLSAARAKLGYAALRALHERACTPLADPVKQHHASYAGLRLAAMDGKNFFCPASRPMPTSSATSVAAPAMPATRRRSVRSWWSAARTLCANLGPYRAREWDICDPLLALLTPAKLCLSGCGFSGYPQSKAAGNT
jgi:hypothetical protein